MLDVPPNPRYASVAAGLSSLIVVAWITVAARIYVRTRIVKILDWGDHLVVLTLLLFTACTATVIYMVKIGLGAPDELTEEALAEILRIYYVSEITYAMATLTLKASVAILLLRFAMSRVARLVIWCTTLGYCAYAVALVLIMALHCIPARRLWDFKTPGVCIPGDVFVDLVYIHAANSIVIDGIYSFLPIALIWNTKMKLQTKISLGIVLGLGVAVAGVNIARTTYVKSMGSHEPDTHGLYGIAITSMLEIGIGTIAAALANLRPLFRHLRSHLVPICSSMLSRLLGDGSSSNPQSERIKAERKVASPPVYGYGLTTVESVEEWTTICVTSHVAKIPEVHGEPDYDNKLEIV